MTDAKREPFRDRNRLPAKTLAAVHVKHWPHLGGCRRPRPAAAANWPCWPSVPCSGCTLTGVAGSTTDATLLPDTDLQRPVKIDAACPRNAVCTRLAADGHTAAWRRDAYFCEDVFLYRRNSGREVMAPTTEEGPKASPSLFVPPCAHTNTRHDQSRLVSTNQPEAMDNNEPAYTVNSATDTRGMAVVPAITCPRGRATCPSSYRDRKPERKLDSCPPCWSSEPRSTLWHTAGTREPTDPEPLQRQPTSSGTACPR